jgi:glycosyltransferase involved in cell wall biosynthesis
MTAIDISVVMSVYNGEKTVARSIESILDQAKVAFEFIIINDGSTDQSLAIIESYAKRDQRIKLSSQPNQGLTKSLITGCQRAQGESIARQDCGDISMPGRLEAQLTALIENPRLSMVSCATEFSTPDGEHLYTARQSNDEARNSLKSLDATKIKGPPHHGSVMFRTSTYMQAGGYRKEFIVAQDLDLWMRLIEHGDHTSLSHVLYKAAIEKNSISSSRRDQQVSTAEFAVRAQIARSIDGNDKKILIELEQNHFGVENGTESKAQSDAAYYYFLGSNLLHNDTLASLKYLTKAIRLNPFNWKIIVKLAYARLTLLKNTN